MTLCFFFFFYLFSLSAASHLCRFHMDGMLYFACVAGEKELSQNIDGHANVSHSSTGICDLEDRSENVHCSLKESQDENSLQGSSVHGSPFSSTGSTSQSGSVCDINSRVEDAVSDDNEQMASPYNRGSCGSGCHSLGGGENDGDSQQGSPHDSLVDSQKGSLQHSLADSQQGSPPASLADSQQGSPQASLADSQQGGPQDSLADSEQGSPQDSEADSQQGSPQDSLADSQQGSPQACVADSQHGSPQDSLADSQHGSLLDSLADSHRGSSRDSLADSQQGSPQASLADSHHGSAEYSSGCSSDSDIQGPEISPIGGSPVRISPPNTADSPHSQQKSGLYSGRVMSLVDESYCPIIIGDCLTFSSCAGGPA